MERLVALTFAALAGLSIAAVAAPETARIRGTVTAIAANQLTIHTPAGKVFMSLGHYTKYLTESRSDLTLIARDSYIGIAARNVGGKEVALGVLIFPASMKGAAEGHVGWDRLPDTTRADGVQTASSMTNGSVAAVTPGKSVTTTDSTMTNGSIAVASERGGARQLMVRYKGGEQMILVLPTAPVVKLRPGVLADVKRGAAVFVNAVTDGTKITAGLIIIGTGGTAPPI